MAQGSCASVSMGIPKNRPAHLNPQQTIPSARDRAGPSPLQPALYTTAGITRICAQGDHSKLHKRDRYLGGSDEFFLNYRKPIKLDFPSYATHYLSSQGETGQTHSVYFDI
jgi:hypothetical protein